MVGMDKRKRLVKLLEARNRIDKRINDLRAEIAGGETWGFQKNADGAVASTDDPDILLELIPPPNGRRIRTLLFRYGYRTMRDIKILVENESDLTNLGMRNFGKKCEILLREALKTIED